MSAEESPYPYSLWKRWDSDDPVGEGKPKVISEKHFFEFCAIPLTGDSFYEDRSKRGAGTDEEPKQVWFLPQYPRLLLRHVPSMVAVFLVLVLVEAELRPTVQGVSTLLPDLPIAPLVYLGVATSALLLVLVTSKIVDGSTVIRAAFVYGLMGILLAGSAYGTYLTLESRGGTETVPHVVYTFPTLLFTLVIGLLAYDLLLRGEHLYTHFGDKNIITGHDPAVADDQSGATSETGNTNQNGKKLYEDIKNTYLCPKLEHPTDRLRYGHLFAALVLLVYLLIWSFKGPLGTGLWSSLLLNVTINLVVLVGVFNFLVGIVFLRNLLNGEYSTDDGVVLQPKYLPFHPDRQGGFAEIGKLAMRINVLFILLGAYYAYRAYISGIRTFPDNAALPFDPLYAELIGIEQSQVLETLFWTVNFIGPVVLYALVVTIWFYYTFWEIHRVMATQKNKLILQKQKEIRAGSADPHYHDSLPYGEYEDKDGWTALYDAPEWPVNAQKLGGLITGNVLPILFSIPTVIPDLLTAWG